MGTKIRLQTCFALPGEVSEMVTLPQGVETVKDLLIYMGRQMDFDFIDKETGRAEEDLEILVNRREVWFYPSVLDTALKDEDLVEIYLLPLGGG